MRKKQFLLILLSLVIVISPSANAATGTIINTNICGELTLVKHHKHYVIAQWRSGAVFEKGEKVSGDDLDNLGVKVLENADGLVGEYYFADRTYPRSGGKTRHRLSITCSSAIN